MKCPQTAISALYCQKHLDQTRRRQRTGWRVERLEAQMRGLIETAQGVLRMINGRLPE